jgi:hypothetical protein
MEPETPEPAQDNSDKYWRSLISDMMAFGNRTIAHWKELYGGGLIGLILGLVASMGYDVPKALSAVFGLGACIAYAAFSAWRVEHHKCKALAKELDGHKISIKRQTLPLRLKVFQRGRRALAVITNPPENQSVSDVEIRILKIDPPMNHGENTTTEDILPIRCSLDDDILKEGQSRFAKMLTMALILNSNDCLAVTFDKDPRLFTAQGIYEFELEISCVGTTTQTAEFNVAFNASGPEPTITVF